jgi:hypothetical protein
MMMVTQYLDVLKEFAVSGKATMVVPHGPSAVSDIESQVKACTPHRHHRVVAGGWLRPYSGN